MCVNYVGLIEKGIEWDDGQEREGEGEGEGEGGRDPLSLQKHTKPTILAYSICRRTNERTNEAERGSGRGRERTFEDLKKTTSLHVQSMD